MRRARIKVMASVPARRKPNRDTNQDSSSPHNDTTGKTAAAPPTEASNDQADEITSASLILQPSVAQSSKVTTESNEVPVNKPPPSPSPPPNEQPQTVDTVDSLIVTEPPAAVESLAKRPNEPSEITLKEICPKEIAATLDNGQITGQDDTRVASANVDAPSPTKTSQTRASFMRPTPRLDGGGRTRRNSVQGSGASASESEDDGRKGISWNNPRNDSANCAHTSKGRSTNNQSTGASANSVDTTIDGNNVCRVDPTTTTTTTTTATSNNSLASTPRQKRKIVMSESARKLAESRREFMLKHERKQPDKTSLIMYDLIYYNPVTNPMKKKDRLAAPSIQRTSSSAIAEEREDEDEEEEEGAETMPPVPQVKVGPDGSLVIDEQSLVIEHTGAKKSRQAMARTEALVDEDANGSGFYKRRQKSKDWPKFETLKFYTALNTVGTDFSLIQSLFPQRTRQEIKLKFKREEKINPRLVEKALADHQEFDIDTLREDLATFEESIKRLSELEKTDDPPPIGRQRGKKRKNVKSRRMAAASILENNDSAGEGEEFSVAGSTCGDAGDARIQEAAAAAATKSSGEGKKSVGRRSVVKDNTPTSRSASASSSCNESGSDDTEIYQVKPTRSGRTRKIRKLQAPIIGADNNTCCDDEEDVDDDRTKETTSPTWDTEKNDISLDNSTEDNEKRTRIGETTRSLVDEPSWKSQSFHNSLSGISQVEPGSLVIVSRESADDPGETVLQVYMVSSDTDDGQQQQHGNALRQNITPIDLTPELLSTVTAGITKVTPIHVKPE